jgi:hypothetical protein
MAEAILLAIPRGHKKSEPDYRKLVVSSGTGVSVLWYDKVCECLEDTRSR